MILRKLSASIVVLSMLSACATFQRAEAKVQAFVAKNQAAITNACEKDILPVVNSPAAKLIGAAVGPVAQATAALGGLCNGAEAIAAAAQSVSTLAWAATELTVIKSGGTTLPPPVAPVQASADTIPADDPKLPATTS